MKFRTLRVQQLLLAYQSQYYADASRANDLKQNSATTLTDLLSIRKRL
jgi:hypothetical protein